MALTYTPLLELGRKMSKFQLPTVDQKIFSSENLKSVKVSIVMFICTHCPYVQAIEERIIALAKEFGDKPVQFVGICSNDWTEYPEDSPENLFERWRKKQYGFPYLFDETQAVAKDFGAVCTPDFFVFDQNQTLRYRGRFDDSWKDPTKVNRQELKSAIEKLLRGEIDIAGQSPSMGCSIKWRHG